MLRFLALVLVVLPVLLPAQVEVALRYERHPDRPRGFVPRGTGSVAVSRELPQGEWKLPRPKLLEPLFGVASLGEGRHLFVLDRSKSGGAYDLLYFDVQGGGDLSKTAPIRGEEPRKGFGLRVLQFPAVDLDLPLAGKRVPYSFKARFHHPEKLPEPGPGIHLPRLYLDANCSWWGEFRLEGLGRFQVALGDAGSNGRFDDGSGARPDEDRRPDLLYLTDGKQITPFDMLHVGRVLVLRGRTFLLGVDIPGRKLTLVPAEEEFPRIRLAMGVDRMTLTGPAGGAALFQCEGEVGLPAGVYALHSYQAVRADEAGGIWRLRTWAGSQGSRVEAGGEGAALLYGEPFTSGVAFTPGQVREGRPNVRPTLAFTLSGAGGEQVNNLDLLTPGKSSVKLSKKRPTRPSEPTYTVIAVDGTVLAEGSFDYG